MCVYVKQNILVAQHALLVRKIVLKLLEQGKKRMPKYIIEVIHNEDGIAVVVKDLDPDTMEDDYEAIKFALEEALRITKNHKPKRFQ